MHLPLAVPFFAILAGCLSQNLTGKAGLEVAVPFALLLGWLAHRYRSSHPVLYVLRIAFLSMTFYLIGVLSTSMQKHPPEFQKQELTGELEVIENVRNKAKVSRAFARIHFKDSLKREHRIQVLLVYFPDSGIAGVASGQTYRYTGTLKPFSPLRNPGNFDARSYYRGKGLSGELTADSLHLVSSNTGKTELREKGKSLLTEQLEKLPHERSQALFTALLSGDKRGIDPETREAFARCGMMHLLAVSGLHTGLLAALPLLLLRRSRRTIWRVIALVMALLIVWSFAWFTGFPASVRRAATMLSLLCVGLSLKKRTSGLNLMFGAGVLMLVDDPALVSDIGFQLSFAAVAAILYWGPLISDLLESRKRWVNRYVSGPAAVSVTAQAGTTPFSLYYFNQFPLLFLPVNLIAVPFATLLLYAMLIRLLLAAAGLHPAFLDHAISGAANLLIECAIVVGKWEWTAVQGVEISRLEAVLWTSLVFLLFRKKPLGNRTLFICFCLTLTALTALIELRIDNRTEIILFSGMDPPLIGYRKGSEALLIKHYERQSTWLAGGWIRKNNPEILVIDEDTTFSHRSAILARKEELIAIDGLLISPDDSLCSNWSGSRLTWTPSSWLLDGEHTGDRLHSALTLRLNSTGQVGAVYAQRRPPIPALHGAVGFD